MEKIIQLSKEELLQTIDKINSLDLKVVSIEEIKGLIATLIKGCPIIAPVFFPGVSLYRAIKYSSRPDNISFLTYPNKAFAKQNRASREGESMFYCSTLRDVPFYELDVKPGDKLVLSRWKLIKKLLVDHIGYLPQKFSELDSRRVVPDWTLNSDGVSILQYPENYFTEENLIVRKYFADSFCQKIDEPNFEKYKLTIAIAEKHYLDKIKDPNHELGKESFDGLIYPTIRMAANADNFAIFPSFVEEEGIKFMSVEYIEVIGINENLDYQWKLISEADVIGLDGLILWKDNIDHWSKKVKFEDLTFNLEDDKWVARDDKGNIVEPD